jgi:4-hydroxybenzoate polyprenyltransferase
LGEGGLVAFNLISALFSQKDALKIGIETLFSFWVMCVLYGFNDYKDVEKDSLNPKKEKGFIKVIVENKNLFFWLINGMYFLTISLSLFVFNRSTAFVLVALYIVNLLLSAPPKLVHFKSRQKSLILTSVKNEKEQIHINANCEHSQRV